MVQTENREEKFNINDMLKKVFLSLQLEADCKECEVVYAMDKSVPKMFRGNVQVIEEYLVKVFHFILKINQINEILVEIHAPKEFVYLEDIIFTVKHIQLHEEDIKILLRHVKHEGNILGATLHTYSSHTISIRIPFAISDFGVRRHYRLPSKTLLQKNVLILAQSENITLSITKMFKYFPYNVDISMKKYQEGEYDLSEYHLIVVEDKLMTETLNLACKIENLKIVILGDIKNIFLQNKSHITASLAKPVTQESIFELIISVFSDEYNSSDFFEYREKLNKSVKKEKKEPVSVKNKSIGSQGTSLGLSGIDKLIEEKISEKRAILNISLGKKNTQNLRLNFEDELENFFDIFNGSDLYFRQLVNERNLQKIKKFCIDLEKYSKIIGAESIIRFVEIINLILVYNTTERLDIYPGRYHIELKKLFKEMEHYFSY